MPGARGKPLRTVVRQPADHDQDSSRSLALAVELDGVADEVVAVACYEDAVLTRSVPQLLRVGDRPPRPRDFVDAHRIQTKPPSHLRRFRRQVLVEQKLEGQVMSGNFPQIPDA